MAPRFSANQRENGLPLPGRDVAELLVPEPVFTKVQRPCSNIREGFGHSAQSTQDTNFYDDSKKSHLNTAESFA
jgi:hypothetical protein